jgi:methionyl aminopeptidase
MLTLRSEREIQKMRRAGLLVWYALQIAGSMMRPDVTTGEIDAQVERFFLDQKSIPLFKGVPGKVPFPAVTCISINDEIVHGIPGKRKLSEGDIVGVDTGCKIDGWCGDAAYTFPIGKISSKATKLLDVTKRTLEIAIESLAVCGKWSEVAAKMEDCVKSNGFSVVENLVGHGIGREMHELPQVPNFVNRELLRYGDFKIQPGLVIAVEPMVNVGTKHIQVEKDHWTIRTKDYQLSAHFEHTLAITKTGVLVLTGEPTNDDERIDVTKYMMT